MKEFSAVVIASLVIIFISVFLIHFSLNSLYIMNEKCAVSSSPPCTETGMLSLLAFTLIVVISFIALIESTIYYIFRDVETNMLIQLSERKKEVKNVKELMRRRKDLRKAKDDARKKYFRREIEERTYNEIKSKYDKELMEIEMKLKKLRLYV